MHQPPDRAADNSPLSLSLSLSLERPAMRAENIWPEAPVITGQITDESPTNHR